MVDDLMLTLSPDPQPIFPSSSLEYDAVSSSDPSSDEEDEEEEPPLNDAVPDPYSSPSSSDLTIPSSAVTVAITPPPTATITTLALPTTTPLDSRRLFQRLWTDEDEMELLQGFLAYTSTRGPTPSGHYHDTSAFYDQIKSKLQLPFNKNQLVEKLRRLKKKYRTNLAKINSSNSSNHFIFKSPHDQATFDISSKIWSHLSATFDADPIPISIQNHNPNPPVTLVAAATPLPKPSNTSYVISHINLNSGTSPATGYDTMLTSLTGNGGGLPKLCTRKRSRITTPTPTPTGRFEEKFANTDDGINLSNTHIASTDNTPPPPTANNNSSSNNNVGAASVGVSSPLQGLVEETLRNCLSPVLKELISSAVNCTATGTTTGLGGGGESPGFKGVGALGLNAVPLNYSGVAVGGICVEGGIDEKWRKQQILELEVYSKRLKLVQEQIKLSLEELRSMQS